MMMAETTRSLRSRARLVRRRGAAAASRPAVASRPDAPAAATIAADEPALRMCGVAYDAGAIRLLQDLHLEVEAGEIVAVVGAPGSPATALLDLAGGRVSAPVGTIETRGELRLATGADRAELERVQARPRARRTAVLFATSDLDAAIAHADRIVVLGQGRILHQVHLHAAAPRDLQGRAMIALRDRLESAVREQPALV
jgi:ABC-type nitrate/sulfonate/bicarbonate transport system ATPase subunit